MSRKLSALARRVRSTSMTAVRQHPIGKREPRAAGQHLAAGGDQRAAVEDRAAGFVAEQVRVSVADGRTPASLPGRTARESVAWRMRNGWRWD